MHEIKPALNPARNRHPRGDIRKPIDGNLARREGFL